MATVTEIYDYLRLLYARLGDLTCYQCGAAIRQQSPEQIQETLLALPSGTRMMILAPIVRGRKGQHREAIEGIRKAGFVRARIDGEMHEVSEPPELAPQKAHTIEAVVDRVVIREGVEPRLAESIQLAVRHGEGLVLASWETRNAAGEAQWHDDLFSTLYSCPDCKISFEEIEPRTFSFNSPYGACPACEGLGARVASDPTEGLQEPVACPECKGARLRPEARAVRLAGKAIHEATAANITAAQAFFQSLEFPPDRRAIAAPIMAKSSRGSSSSPRSGSAILRSTVPPKPSAAASCSASAWPVGWAQGWSASVMCSTSPRSGCIPATISG